MTPYLDNTKQTLSSNYPDNNVVLESIDYCGIISTFFVSIHSNENLDAVWNGIAGIIASYYQPYLRNDFEKWNLYIIYMCDANIEISLKYKIENDKFSSRKIVISNIINNSQNINKIISNFITNSDLKPYINQDIAKRKNYDSNSKIWKLLNKENIKQSKLKTSEVDLLLVDIKSYYTNED